MYLKYTAFTLQYTACIPYKMQHVLSILQHNIKSVPYNHIQRIPSNIQQVPYKMHHVHSIIQHVPYNIQITCTLQYVYSLYLTIYSMYLTKCSMYSAFSIMFLTICRKPVPYNTYTYIYCNNKYYFRASVYSMYIV